MNIPRDDDIPTQDSGLSPEERALAQRLSQLDARAAPSPALDARILAAARGVGQPADRVAAAGRTPSAGQPARPQRRRPRWPVPLGIAASLALAVGVAWQLRPQPETHLEDHAPAASPAPERTATADAVARQPAPTQAASTQTAPAAEAVVAAEPSSTSPAATQSREIAAAPPAAAIASREPSNTRRQPEADTRAVPAPGMVPPPPPPAPPAPAVAELRFTPSPIETQAAAQAEAMKADAYRSEAAVQMQRARAQDTTRAQTAAVPQAAPSSPAATPAPAPLLDSLPVTGSRIRSAHVVDAHHDQPMDDQPPATVDSPEVRKAWLHRVRELRDDGHLDAARASLREFHRRYPDAVLPDDLRPLLDE